VRTFRLGGSLNCGLDFGAGVRHFWRVNSFLTKLTSAALLLWASHACGQRSETLPANGREFLQWLEEANEAQSVADRLQKQTRALDAVLHADTDLLAEALETWQKEGGSNLFVTMAWRQLTRRDEARALQMVEKARGRHSFDGTAVAVYGSIAHTDPDRTCEEVRRISGSKNTHHWNAALVMMDVGEEWFRRERQGALARLESSALSREMTAALFEGFVEAAATVDERLALLERFVSHEKPVVAEITKEPHIMDDLVQAAASEDLAKTRASIERLFPAGVKRPVNSRDGWIAAGARYALFRSWAKADPMAAAGWLMTQHGKDDPYAGGALQSCADAIAGKDREHMAEALDWLTTQPRKDEVISAVAKWLDHPARTTSERSSRLIVGRWLAGLPSGEREGVLTQAFESSYYGEKPFQPKADDPFVMQVFPEEVLRKQVVQRMKPAVAEAKAAGSTVTSAKAPPFSFALADQVWPSWASDGFDVPVEHGQHEATPQEMERSLELGSKHRLTWAARDPAECLAGLKVLQWMHDAAPPELQAVLLAHLQEGRGEMSLFANDLLECWVERDWRACESFAWQADLPLFTRRKMLVQVFRQAALRFPDEMLLRVRELFRDGKLAQDALNADFSGQRSRHALQYDCNDITRNLGLGWTRQNEAETLSKIQTLPRKWQPLAFESFAESFTTAEAGLEMLGLILKFEAREQPAEAAKVGKSCGMNSDSWNYARGVLSRLAGVSFSKAKAWLEAKPERMIDNGDRNADGVWMVYEAWRDKEAQAADEWLWRNRPGEIAMHRIISRRLNEEDPGGATAWLEAHRDHPGVDGGLAAFADQWRTTKPQEAARYVLQMMGNLRQVYAIYVMQSWQETDAGAAAKFMDQAFPPGTPERKATDAEIKRIDDIERSISP